ncbi:MAG TPA: LysR substrate-binding domain-containing protein [Acetobacteraceae bacterium]|nr:LysR substrate-binding domain-containing protein [Acetobacteraceae bacterium]
MSGGSAPVSLRALEAFCAIMRQGSVVRAARELGVTPSALSHLLRVLEDRLGVKLLERSGRGVVPSEDGRTLAGTVDPAMAAIAAALEGFGRRRTELRISTLSTFATRWLIPRLARFQARQPDVELLISTSTRPVDFAREAFDCAIRFGTNAWPGLMAERLYTEELVPACSPALIGPAGLRRPADLARARLLHARARRGDWDLWLAAAGIAGIDTAHGPVLETRNLAIQAAIGQMGVAVVDRRLIEQEMAAGQLAVPFGPALPIAGGYWLVSRPGQASRPFSAFRTWLLDECGRPELGSRT